MHEILRRLSPVSAALDLGSGKGSFDTSAHEFLVVRFDRRDPPPGARQNFVLGDASQLPFSNQTFEAVICNHSLEHFNNLAGVLQEIARICKRSAALYVAVPDSTTLTDRLYRWLARGGGHINRFSDVECLSRMIEDATGLPHTATRPLCTSLSFLNSKNRRSRPPRRLLLLAGGSEFLLIVLNFLFRISDRLFGTRLSLYGWALYFGRKLGPIDTHQWINVCVRCGAGHPSDWLLGCGAVRRSWVGGFYTCPYCQAVNLFFDDRSS